MNLRFVANYQRGVVDLQLYDEIGYNPENGRGISGRQFAAEIQWLDSQPDVSVIRVRVNSPGGLVIDALSIISAIRNCTKTVETYIDGVAASSAGLIAVVGKKRYMSDFGRLMVHAPSVTGQARENMDESTLKSVDALGDLIADVLSGNSEVKKAKMLKYIEAETWFNSKEALAEGLVDEIINTGRKAPVLSNTASIAEVCNSINSILQSNTETMKTVKNFFQLPESANEAEVLEKVSNLEIEKTKAKNELTEVKNKLAQAETKLRDQAKAAATAVVNSAIAAGKIGAEKREELVALGVENMGLLEAMFAAIPTPAANVSNHLNPNDKGGESKVVDGKFDGKTYRELEKSSPATISNLLKTDKKTHDELYKAQYGTDFAG
jgi:ATP-dependent protease ClpP protease subunit